MTFAKYLRYRLKNSSLRSAIFSVLSLAIVLYVIAEHNRHTNTVNVDANYLSFNETGLYMLAIVMGFFATLIPMLETACFKSRRNLDTLYCLPIKRSKLALAHYLSGYIQLAFVYSVNFFGAYIWLALNTDFYALGWMMLYYLFSLVLGFILYSIFIFLFSEANTVLDGVVFSALWIFALYLVMYALFTYIRYKFDIPDFYKKHSYLIDWGIVYGPLNALTVIFRELIEINRKNSNLTAEEVRSMITLTSPWLIIGIAAAYGYFRNMLKKGAQLAGEISSSWFGYKLIIPLYAYSLAVIMNISNADVIFFVFLLIAMTVGYTMWRRSFKFKLADYLIIALSFAVAVLTGL